MDLQLLAAGLQLLGGDRNLVHRLQFFVAGLQLLGGRFILFDGVAQVRFQPLQFAFEVA
jgi:hypothetical protein